MDRIAWSKPVIALLALSPLTWMIWATLQRELGADPVATLTHETGIWALRFLLLSLCITPARQWTGAHWLIRYRRMLGLFAAFYATAHLAIYVFLDLGTYWQQILEDIVKRPYITVGFLAWLLLMPLAITSTKGWQRRLKRNWKRLHNLVYLITILACLHFLWLVKAGLLEPGIYTAIAALLLGYRLLKWHQKRHRTTTG